MSLSLLQILWSPFTTRGKRKEYIGHCSCSVVRRIAGWKNSNRQKSTGLNCEEMTWNLRKTGRRGWQKDGLYTGGRTSEGESWFGLKS